MALLGKILKEFKRTNVDEDNLLPRLDKYLNDLNGCRMIGKPEKRAENCWHPSSLSTSNCVRFLVYLWLKTEPSNPKRVNSKGRRVFDIGHHVGYMIQQYFWDMGILEGEWHCIICKHQWWDVSPRKCPKCSAELEIWYNLQYKEVPIINKKKNIMGHADGIVRLENGRRRMIEIKSIKNRDYNTKHDTVTFDELIQPLQHHMYQVNLYLDSDTMKELDVNKASIIYFAKNSQDWKEFSLSPMPELVKEMYLKIDMVNDALENRYLPERVGEMDCEECKYCPMKDYCHTVPHTFEDADMRHKEKAVVM